MRILLARIGAKGDAIIVTPLFRYLKNQGHEVYVLASDAGRELYEGNSHIDKLMYHVKDSIPCDKLGEYFEAMRKGFECDKLINLCESIECQLALHPGDPKYNWIKPDRITLCNKNYYDYTFQFAGLPIPEKAEDKRPELYFGNNETQWIQKLMAKEKGIHIVWGLSGSGRNKCYPYSEDIWKMLLDKYENIIIYTVGDEVCKILEDGIKDPRMYHLSGLWEFHKSALATKYSDLVISPDTGLLHAAGCFDTPKIGMLTHSTIENITKYFVNDYSIEAKCDCAPCFKLIYDADWQCPVDPNTGACWCMGRGIPKETLFNRICEVIEKHYADRIRIKKT